MPATGARRLLSNDNHHSSLEHVLLEGGNKQGVGGGTTAEQHRRDLLSFLSSSSSSPLVRWDVRFVDAVQQLVTEPDTGRRRALACKIECVFLQPGSMCPIAHVDGGDRTGNRDGDEVVSPLCRTRDCVLRRLADNPQVQRWLSSVSLVSSSKAPRLAGDTEEEEEEEEEEESKQQD